MSSHMEAMKIYLDERWEKVKDRKNGSTEEQSDPECFAIGDSLYLWGNYQAKSISEYVSVIEKAMRLVSSCTRAYPDKKWRKTTIAFFEEIKQKALLLEKGDKNNDGME